MKMNNSKKKFINLFIKSFIFTSIAILFVVGLALADTGTKEVAGYMGDKALQIYTENNGIKIKLFDNTFIINKPLIIDKGINFISNTGKSIYEFIKGLNGLNNFSKLII
jgi:hypothetical protein